MNPIGPPRPEIYDIVDLVAKSLGALIALVGAIYTWRQYVRGRRWRGADFASSLLAELTSDDELALICFALDWEIGPIVVPERYRRLLEQVPGKAEHATPEERGEVMAHHVPTFARAVRIYLDFTPADDPKAFIYRCCFDRFCAHLANIARMVEERQIDWDDVTPLKYWLQRLSIYEYGRSVQDGQAIFRPFLKHKPFGYLPVIRLAERFGISEWDIPEGIESTLPRDSSAPDTVADSPPS